MRSLTENQPIEATASGLHPPPATILVPFKNTVSLLCASSARLLGIGEEPKHVSTLGAKFSSEGILLQFCIRFYYPDKTEAQYAWVPVPQITAPDLATFFTRKKEARSTLTSIPWEEWFILIDGKLQLIVSDEEQAIPLDALFQSRIDRFLKQKQQHYNEKKYSRDPQITIPGKLLDIRAHEWLTTNPFPENRPAPTRRPKSSTPQGTAILDTLPADLKLDYWHIPFSSFKLTVNGHKSTLRSLIIAKSPNACHLVGIEYSYRGQAKRETLSLISPSGFTANLPPAWNFIEIDRAQECYIIPPQKDTLAALERLTTEYKTLSFPEKLLIPSQTKRTREPLPEDDAEERRAVPNKRGRFFENPPAVPAEAQDLTAFLKAQFPPLKDDSLCHAIQLLYRNHEGEVSKEEIMAFLGTHLPAFKGYSITGSYRMVEDCLAAITDFKHRVALPPVFNHA